MYKKTITYSDYSDKPQEITETFYFELSMVELIENGWAEGALQEELNRCVDNNKLADMVKLLKKLIKASYGVRTADRKSFVKDEEMTKKFMQSNAYNAIIEEVFNDATGKILQDFIIGILPKTVNGQTVNYDEAVKQAKKEVAEMYGIDTKEVGEIIDVTNNDTEK